MKLQLNIDFQPELMDRILEQCKVENLQPVPFIRKVLRKYLEDNNNEPKLLKLKRGREAYIESLRELKDKLQKDEKTTI
jgi:hypothetical protein